MTATRSAAQQAAIAQAAAYGRTLGGNGAAHAFAGIGAEDAVKVLALARRGELAEAAGYDGIAGRVTARDLARDLAVRPGTRLAGEMHEAMCAAWGPAFYDGAITIAQDALPGDAYA